MEDIAEIAENCCCSTEKKTVCARRKPNQEYGLDLVKTILLFSSKRGHVPAKTRSESDPDRDKTRRTGSRRRDREKQSKNMERESIMIDLFFCLGWKKNLPLKVAHHTACKNNGFMNFILRIV